MLIGKYSTSCWGLDRIPTKVFLDDLPKYLDEAVALNVENIVMEWTYDLSPWIIKMIRTFWSQVGYTSYLVALYATQESIQKRILARGWKLKINTEVIMKKQKTVHNRADKLCLEMPVLEFNTEERTPKKIKDFIINNTK